jgi:hypothetical protein
MGMPAEQAMAGTIVQINDLVIRGYFLSIDVGSAEKRVAIGFGSGESALQEFFADCTLPFIMRNSVSKYHFHEFRKQGVVRGSFVLMLLIVFNFMGGRKINA